MKNYISNTVGKVVMVVAFFASVVSQAKASDSTRSLPEVVIKYEGQTDGRPVFSVRFINNIGSPLVLSIADEEGMVLYEERSGRVNYTKKFALDFDNVADISLLLTVSDTQGGKKKTYSISSTTVTTQDFSISMK